MSAGYMRGIFSSVIVWIFAWDFFGYCLAFLAWDIGMGDGHGHTLWWDGITEIVKVCTGIRQMGMDG